MPIAGTGIPELDRLLGGGIEQGHSVLMEADVGTLLERFLLVFAKEGVDKGECVCYISLDRNLQSLTHLIQFESPSLLETLGKNLFVVDLQSRKETDPSEALLKGVLTVSDPSNPSIVTESVGSFFAKLKQKEKRVRFVTNSISDAITTYGLTPAYQMSKELLTFAKRSEFVGINTIYPKMHTRQENATIEHIHDGVVELSTSLVGTRLQKHLQVRSMIGARFSPEIVPYEYVEGKIALWTRLTEDFEAVKKGMTLEPDGTLMLMGTRGQLISERSLANLTSIILKEAGYERGGSMLYEYTRTSAGRTAEEISKAQQVSGIDILKTYLRFSQMTGSGVFSHISLDEKTGAVIVHAVNLLPNTLKFDRQVHFRDAGAIAGVLEFATGRPYKVEETRCVCKGDQHCEFVGKPL